MTLYPTTLPVLLPIIIAYPKNYVKQSCNFFRSPSEYIFFVQFAHSIYTFIFFSNEVFRCQVIIRVYILHARKLHKTSVVYIPSSRIVNFSRSFNRFVLKVLQSCWLWCVLWRGQIFSFVALQSSFGLNKVFLSAIPGQFQFFWLLTKFL